MDIPSHELKAFVETARLQNMTLASKKLFITQSALSQRIQKLESLLECTLFIRHRSGLKLTDAGQKLLQYAHSLKGIEEEFLNAFNKEDSEHFGHFRIAGFSSVLRSLLIPALAPFLRKNPKVNCEFQSHEVVDLAGILERSEADIIITDYRMNKFNVSETFIGHEEYVVIESSKFKSPDHLYLDHGPHDNATESFFATQKDPPKAYRRAFMGDVYGILDGVEQGLGRAVMSKHLIKDRKGIKVLSGYKKYTREIVAHHFKRDYLPKTFQAILHELCKIHEQIRN